MLTVDEWAHRSQEVWDSAHVCLQRAIWRQWIQADCHRRPHPPMVTRTLPSWWYPSQQRIGTNSRHWQIPIIHHPELTALRNACGLTQMTSWILLWLSSIAFTPADPLRALEAVYTVERQRRVPRGEGSVTSPLASGHRKEPSPKF